MMARVYLILHNLRILFHQHILKHNILKFLRAIIESSFAKIHFYLSKKSDEMLKTHPLNYTMYYKNKSKFLKVTSVVYIAVHESTHY